MRHGMREMTGYRVKYWPWGEKIAYKLLDKAGYKDQKVKRLTWFDELGSPEKV
jgi:hypothetical protein